MLYRVSRNVQYRRWIFGVRQANLGIGGKGGWSFLTHEQRIQQQRNNFPSEMCRQNGLRTGPTNIKAAHLAGKCTYDNFRGKKHTEATKLKMSVAISAKCQGKDNSQFGTMWITNGTDNRKIKKDISIPEGWYRGRK